MVHIDVDNFIKVGEFDKLAPGRIYPAASLDGDDRLGEASPSSAGLLDRSAIPSTTIGTNQVGDPRWADRQLELLLAKVLAGWHGYSLKPMRSPSLPIPAHQSPSLLPTGSHNPLAVA
jgi:hypothetical protein